MSEYLFGLGRGRVSDREAKRADRIASKHGATFVRYCDPNCNYRFWFAGPNYGAPFNESMADAVLAEVGKIKTKK